MSSKEDRNGQPRDTEFAGLVAIMFIALLGVLVGLFLGSVSCGVDVI